VAARQDRDQRPLDDGFLPVNDLADGRPCRPDAGDRGFSLGNDVFGVQMGNGRVHRAHGGPFAAASGFRHASRAARASRAKIDAPGRKSCEQLQFQVCNFRAGKAISRIKRGETVAFPICCDLVHHGMIKVISLSVPHSLVREAAWSLE
jgi:hypothetical protein